MIKIFKDSNELGKAAAEHSGQILRKAIKEQGFARVIFSTGASQFDLFTNLLKEDIDWTKVEMFHLDEYIDLPESHPASFRKYLKERFTTLVDLKEVYFVEGEGDIEENIASLTGAINESPVDLALIGIGENAHIAFNDPPADFDSDEAFIVVELDDKCKRQQVGEGWFENVDMVPNEAITMTCKQILKSKNIISVVPYGVKAEAVKLTLESELTNEIPATILKTHDNWTLYLDEDSAELIDKE